MKSVNKNHLLFPLTALLPLADQGFHLLLTIVAETAIAHVHLILPLLIAVATLPLHQLLLLIPLIPITTVKGILSNNSSNDTHKEDQ